MGFCCFCKDTRQFSTFGRALRHCVPGPCFSGLHGRQQNYKYYWGNWAFGHALLWALTLKGEPGQLLLVADSKYAIKAVQALQRCNSNVALVHTVRRIWRAVVAEREVVADHIKGHSEDPWNEFSDVLADYVHFGGTFPGEHGILPQWYAALCELRDATNLALPCTALPFFTPLSRSTKPL